MDTLNRRDFLRATAGAAAAATLPSQPAARAAGNDERRMIGIQVGTVSFVDEGVERVLDAFQKRAEVNTLFLAVFTFSRGTGGRQVPGQPLPDHGKQEYDLNWHGGLFCTLHPEYFKDAALKDVRAPDFGKLDILEEVLPPAKKRGIQTYAWLFDGVRHDLPNIEKLQEIDLHGRTSPSLCYYNPETINFWLAVTENVLRPYDIDGVMCGIERQGPFNNAIGAMHGGLRNDPGRVTCFCQYHQEKAKQRGISFDRVREGYLELEKFVRASRAKQRPSDGYFVTLWRLILRYPEILAYETLWMDGLQSLYKAMYEKAKSIKPGVPVGWHIWHNNSFSPFYRAEQDLSAFTEYSDFMKIVMYNNCGGERMDSYIDSVHGTIFEDVPKEELLEFHYRLLNYQERSYAEIPFTGLSSDYVFRETKRALDDVAGKKTLIWPGIDIDIPTKGNHSKCTPQGVEDAVTAALRAGAPGVILSRKYSEMKLANLSGAGAAIRKFQAS